jgi:hypothetical protein
MRGDALRAVTPRDARALVRPLRVPYQTGVSTALSAL